MDGIGGIGSTAPIELPEIVVTPDDALPDDTLPGDGSFGDPIAGFQATNAQMSTAVNGLSQQIDATIEQMRAMGPPTVPALLSVPVSPPVIAPPAPDLFIPPPAPSTEPASATTPAAAVPAAEPGNTGSPAGGLPPQAAALGIAATVAAPQAPSALLAAERQALVRVLPWVGRFAGTPALVVGLASEVFNFGSIPNDAQERAMREAAERSAVPVSPDQTQRVGSGGVVVKPGSGGSGSAIGSSSRLGNGAGSTARVQHPKRSTRSHPSRSSPTGLHPKAIG
jgi:hypothetical protein